MANGTLLSFNHNSETVTVNELLLHGSYTCRVDKVSLNSVTLGKSYKHKSE